MATVPAWVKSWLTVDDSVIDDQFTLTDSGSTNQSDKRPQGDARHAGRPQRRAEAVSAPVRPTPIKEWASGQSSGQSRDDSHTDDPDYVSPVLKESEAYIKASFRMPENADAIVRTFTIGGRNGWPAFAVYIDGISDKLIINTHVLEPLMLLARPRPDVSSHERVKVVEAALLPSNQVSVLDKWEKVIPAVLTGSSVVFVDGCDCAIVVETKGWEHRAVSTPQTEAVVRGPHDAFTENFRANTGLIRARLRSERLVTEMLSVGRLARTDVAVMYIDGLTNPNLVDELKRRIESIDVDYLSESGAFEQFIEDSPWLSVPQVLSTERPDRIAAMLTEGHVAIFVGQSPYVLAVPVVLWTMVHSPEDAYLHVPFGSFLRLVRWLALFTAILMPSFYIAVTNYHPEMLPTDLLLAIAGAREQVPFPVIFEMLVMEFAIELIREAGVRIPSVIGPTIGIVGALIIGQTAVQAGIVSPLLVIVIAVTALAGFTIPNYNLGFAVRIIRFVFLFAAAFFGFYGIGLLGAVILVRLCVQKSFGVPLLAPIAPSMGSSPDVIMRGPAYLMNKRPTYLRTQRKWREEPITRPWSHATSRKSQGSPGQGDDKQ